MSRLIVVAIVALVMTGCAETPDPTEDILALMREAEAGWNAGEIERYMQCYWKSDELRFAGGARINRGWEAVLASYRKGYPDQAAMGRLTFSELDVTVLAEDAAVVFGRWRLDRDGEVPDAAPHGLYTLVLRRFEAGWRIVHDHTSAADLD